jgi:hypothetical protein
MGAGLSQKQISNDVVAMTPTSKPMSTSFSAASVSGETGNIDKGKILAKWSEVLAKIKKYNHSLSFILRVCEPRDISGTRLCLAFKYKFHKKRMEEANIRAMVEKVLAEVYNMPITIEAVIDESLEVGDIQGTNARTAQAGSAETREHDENKDSGSNMIDNLLKTFGGKIINN